jgi:hypothetical protein
LWVAARVVCTAAATLTVLLLLQYRMTVPFDAIGLGLMVSIFAIVNLRDPTPVRQRATLLVIPLPALGAWALAAYLNHWQWLADIGFILVVFCASLARLLRPRGTAWGMVAYIAYFISDVTRSHLSHHSVILLAVGVAICAGYLNRFYVWLIILRRRSIAFCAICGVVLPAFWVKSRLLRGLVSRMMGTGLGAIVNSSAFGLALSSPSSRLIPWRGKANRAK